MTLNLKKKVTLTASQMLAENNRATADRLTWAAQTDEMNLRTALNVPENGLTEEMAEEARDRYGRNVLPTSQRTPLYKRLAAAFINPFTVVLVLLAIFSALTNVAMVDPGDESWATVIIITIMVLISGILRFVQETRSGNVAAKLSEMIHTTVCVTREGEKKEIPLEEIVVGDIVSLSAGDMLPADVRILRAKDLQRGEDRLCSGIEERGLRGGGDEADTVFRGAERGADPAHLAVDSRLAAGTQVHAEAAELLPPGSENAGSSPSSAPRTISTRLRRWRSMGSVVSWTASQTEGMVPTAVLAISMENSCTNSSGSRDVLPSTRSICSSVEIRAS